MAKKKWWRQPWVAPATLVASVVVGSAALHALQGRRFRGLRGAVTPVSDSVQFDNAPAILHRLPFNSLRSNLPIDSPAFVQAVEQLRAGEESVAMFPQSMAFSKWRQGAGAFGESIHGLMKAKAYQGPLLDQLAAPLARVPSLSMHEAAAPMTFLPNTGNRYEDPIARGIGMEQALTTYQLNEFGRGAAASVVDGDAEVMARVSHTPLEIAAAYETVWDGNQLRYVPRES